MQSCPQAQAQQLSTSSPETAGKPPNHFQTSNQEPTLTLKGSPCELSGRRGSPLGAPPLLGASSGGGATPGKDWPQEVQPAQHLPGA